MFVGNLPIINRIRPAYSFAQVGNPTQIVRPLDVTTAARAASRSSNTRAAPLPKNDQEISTASCSCAVPLAVTKRAP